MKLFCHARHISATTPNDESCKIIQKDSESIHSGHLAKRSHWEKNITRSFFASHPKNTFTGALRNIKIKRLENVLALKLHRWNEFYYNIVIYSIDYGNLTQFVTAEIVQILVSGDVLLFQLKTWNYYWYSKHLKHYFLTV